MYQATINRPFHPPITQQGTSLRKLLKEIRITVVTGPHGTSADVEHIAGDDKMQMARYENVEGKLKKVV